ncbi:MAG: hypothetical protein ACPGJV_00365 [Bacteriovoracaceae bacterium]
MSQFSTLVLLTLFTIGCSNNVEDINSTIETSNIGVELITKTSEGESTPLNEYWPEVKTKQTTGIKVKLNNLATTENIIDTEILITPLDSEGKPFTDKTDITGAIYWEISAEYNWFEQERFIKKSYRLKSTGKFQLDKVIHIGFNPWTKEIRDLSKQDIESQVVRHNMDSNEYFPMSLENISFERIEDQALQKVSKTQIKESYYLEFQVDLHRYKYEGDLASPISVKRGLFDLEVKLIETSINTGNAHVISEGNIQDIELKNGFFKGDIELIRELRSRTIKDNPVKVVFKLTPKKINLSSFNLYAEQLMNGINNINSASAKPLVHHESENIETIAPLNETLDTLLSDIGLLEEGHNKTAIAFDREESERLAKQAETIQSFIISKLDLSDGDNVTEYDDPKTSVRVRQVNINGVLFDNLTESNTTPLKSGEFKIEVKPLNGTQKDWYPKQRQIIYDSTKPKGEFQTYIWLPYNLYAKERFHEYEIKIIGTSGKWDGWESTRKIAYNPHTNKGYDLHYYDGSLNIKSHGHPRIFVSKFSAENPKINYGEAYIDRNFTFGVNIDIELEIALEFDRLNHVGGQLDMTFPITFGDYKFEVFTLVPITIDSDPNSPNLRDFKLVSAATFTKAIKPQTNVVEHTVKLPYLITDIPTQHIRNALVVHVTPASPDNPLAPTTVSMPIRLRQKSLQSKSNREHLKDFYKELIFSGEKDSKQNRIHDIMNGGVHYIVEESSKRNSSIDGEDLYQQHFERHWNKANIAKLNYETFYDKVKSRGSNLKKDEFNMLLNGKNRTFSFKNAVCYYHYYETLKYNEVREQDYDKYQELYKQFLDCKNNPKRHFDIIPVSHIVSLWDHYDARFKKDGIASVTKVAELSNQTIQRGKSYFAGTGEKYTKSEGERDAERLNFEGKVAMESPSPFFFNYAVSRSTSYETYQAKSKANYFNDAHRSYTTLVSQAEFEWIELEFFAKIKNCVKAESKNYLYYICESKNHKPYYRTKKVREKWYQINNKTNLSQRQTLTNGEAEAGDGGSLFGFQLIRGAYNFALQWSHYMDENKHLEVEDVTDKIKIPRDLHEDLKLMEGEIPQESLIQNAFPGVFITPVRIQ